MRGSTEQRRLLAVLVADIVGYSRLMAEDEADTFYRVKDLQSSLIVPVTERGHGRIVKWTGDGFIGVFDSAVDAIRAAVEIQSGVAAAGAGAPEDRRIRLRIGINVGDVIVVADDIYGDTVNIAARLEALAAPGGICISRGVRDTVRGKFSVEFEDRGEVAVKNIPEPIGTFSVIFDPIAWTTGRGTSPAARRPPFPRRLVAAGFAAVLLATTAVAAYFLGAARERSPPATPPAHPTPIVAAGAATVATLRTELAARLLSAVPKLDQRTREERARDYDVAPGHKALAVSPDPPGTWRAVRPAVEGVKIAALEGCQLYFGQPCILLASDDTVEPQPADGKWERRDMPRIRYDGAFAPGEIPGLRPDQRHKPEILGYRAAAAPKAAAIHPRGYLFVVGPAASQRSAEEEALKACNADPNRNGADGTCLLYASGDQIVLPRRSREPVTAATAAASPAPTAATPAAVPATPAAAKPAAVPATPAATSPAPLRDLLAARLAAAFPNEPAKKLEEIARIYEGGHGHKAQAAALQPAAFWRTNDRSSAEEAETAVLESCQIVFGQPCLLLAVDETVPPAPADGAWPRRDMPRARYSGSFDPGQIPSALSVMRERPDIVGYRAAASPKAAAFTPIAGRVFPVTAAASQRAAEEAALAACHDDQLRRAPNGPCFLYAVGNEVVLPRRLKEPLTPAAPAR
jgi:class 3 adenylate cyclase